ncbi:MAG: acetyl-CoA C-acyltransferase [Chitinophagaceae bacterium]|nr:acetyl-CoA C-acyltransferase [Chitinophagaceae bacterium]
MQDVFVADVIRTPIGKYGGALAHVRPDDLLAHVIGALLQRHPNVDVNEIEDVVAGAANQAGEDNRNVARMALLLAGLPVTTGGVTVNRLCASGMQAIMDAARQVACGEAEIIIACGVESMSRAPFVLGKNTEPFSRNAEIYDTTLGWRFINPRLAALHHPYSMGETAENVARQWKISREQQDRFALRSQQRYFATKEAGKWNEEIIPVQVTQKGQTIIVSEDEHPRQTSLEKLASLKPVFAKDGTVTAGNSSGINDGAAAMLLVSEKALNKYHLKPLARIRAMAVAGVDPAIMGIGPVPATQKALKRAGLNVKDIELVELNEAFASQSLACIHELQLNEDIVNVNGGAIALGHPLGCSGVRISCTLLYEMRRRKAKYGLATMCIGVGQGATIIFENAE